MIVSKGVGKEFWNKRDDSSRCHVIARDATNCWPDVALSTGSLGHHPVRWLFYASLQDAPQARRSKQSSRLLSFSEAAMDLREQLAGRSSPLAPAMSGPLCPISVALLANGEEIIKLARPPNVFDR